MNFKSLWILFKPTSLSASWTLLAFLVSVLAAPAWAQSQPESTSDYYDAGKVSGPGTVLCGVIVVNETTPRCFIGLGEARTLTPTADPSGQLAKGSSNPAQGIFDQVVVGELMIEIDESLGFRGVTDKSAPRMLLAKISWQGRAGQQLENPVGAKDVAIGEVVVNAAGTLEYRLLSLPTQMSSLGFLYPQKQTAEIFGGDSNSDEVKQSLLQWTQKVLSTVVPENLASRRLAARAQSQIKERGVACAAPLSALGSRASLPGGPHHA